MVLIYEKKNPFALGPCPSLIRKQVPTLEPTSITAPLVETFSDFFGTDLIKIHDKLLVHWQA